MSNPKQVTSSTQANNGYHPALLTARPSDLSSKVSYLTKFIQSKLREIDDEGRNLDRSLQEELSNLINLLQDIEKRFICNSKKVKECDTRQAQLNANIDFIEVAILALFQKRPNLCLAKRIRRQIEYAVHESFHPIRGAVKNSILKVVHLGATPSKVLLGMAVALPLYLSALFGSINTLTEANSTNPSTVRIDSTSRFETLNSPAKNSLMSVETFAVLTLVASAGALGSVISILTRIEKYQNKDYDDSMLPIFIGAAKPLIGASFGVLVFTLICANISPIQLSPNANTPETKGFTFFSLAFLIGFSERFAHDIVSRAETSFSASSHANDTKQSAERGSTDEKK